MKEEFNIYTPQTYKLKTHDPNLISIILLVHAKIMSLLDELEIKYFNMNSLFRRHIQWEEFESHNFNSLQLLENLANTSFYKKTMKTIDPGPSNTKEFNKAEHENAINRLQLTPEYIFTYYRYLTDIVIESFIKTSKFILDQNQKSNIIKECIVFLAKNNIQENNILQNIDKILTYLSEHTVAI